MSEPLTESEVAYLWAELGQRDAIITSLRASLDDAYREISRLTAEKHTRDLALRRVIEAAESVHAQGERG